MISLRSARRSKGFPLRTELATAPDRCLPAGRPGAGLRRTKFMPMWTRLTQVLQRRMDAYAAGHHGTVKHPSIAKERGRRAKSIGLAVVKRLQKTRISWNGETKSSDGEV